jgi:hypothetical protein
MNLSIKCKENFSLIVADRTGTLYSTLGNNLARQGRWDEALESQMASEVMLGKTMGPNHHRYADTLYKIGWLYCRRGRLAATTSLPEEAVTDTTEYEEAR